MAELGQKETPEPTVAIKEELFEPTIDSCCKDMFLEDPENEYSNHSDLSDSDEGDSELKPMSGGTFEMDTEEGEALGKVVVKVEEIKKERVDQTEMTLSEPPASPPMRLRHGHQRFKCVNTFSTRAKFKEHQPSHEQDKDEDPMSEAQDDAANKETEYNAHTSSEENVLDRFSSDASSVTSEPVQKRKRFYRNAVKKLKCKVVGCPGPEAFLREENFTCHQSFHGRFQCVLCDSSYDYAPDLSLHELETHRNDTRTGNWVKKILPCPRPNGSYSTGDQKKFLRHHLREHLGLDPKGLEDSDNCEICGIFFIGQRIVRSLQGHFDDFHNLDKLKEGETSLKCDQEGCSAYFLQPTQLWAHKRDVHEIFKCFNCSDCDAVFKNSAGLIKHRQKHHPECFIYPCTFKGCTQRFKTKGGLETHIKLKHDIAKQVKCPACDKLFSNGHILQFHMKSHQPKIKRQICEKCGKKFKSPVFLKLHSFSHSGPSSWEFTCSVCSKKLLTKQKLAEHMRTHYSQEKPYVCEFCGAQYAQRHNLRIHVNNKHGDQVQDVPKKYDKRAI